MRTTRVGIGALVVSALAGCGSRTWADDSTESHWLSGASKRGVVSPEHASEADQGSAALSIEASGSDLPSASDTPSVSEGFASDDSSNSAVPNGANANSGYDSQWVRQWGGVHQDVVDEVGDDAEGNLVVVGHVEVGSNDVGAEDRSQFIVKLSPEGEELLRIQTEDRREIDIPANLTVNPTGDFVVAATIEGHGFGDASVTHYDPGGQVLWTTTWGDSRTEEVFDVALDAARNVYVVGGISNDPDEQEHAFLTKLDADGKLLWTRELPGEAYELATQIAVDGQGHILLAVRRGYVKGALDASVRKLDADGNLLWEQVWDGPEDTTLFSLCTDAAGNVFIGGSQEEAMSDRQGLVAQLDPDGAVVWSRSTASTASEVTGVVPTSHGSIIVGGRGNAGAIRLTEFDSDGNATWGATLGENEAVMGVAFTNDRVVVVGGTYSDLDGVNAGNADAYVWVLGSELWGR